MELSITLVTCFYVHILTQVLFFENNAMPRWNQSVLNIPQKIKFVMSFASEAELGSLFITAQEMLAMRNTLE